MTLLQCLSLKLVCVCAITYFSGVLSQSPTPDRAPTAKYPHVTNMDQEGEYILRWGFDDTKIWFEVQVHTLGYVGFGISESGLMVPADVVVGYISNGQVIFRDYHTTAYRHPVIDGSQDWTIEYGFEENGWTVLAFNRSLDTCDTDGDRPITRDTLQVIYSYSSVKPSSPTGLSQHEKRGSKAISLITRSPPPRFLPADSQTIDFFLNDNFTIPSDSTSTFQCKVFDLSSVAQKYHIIKASPILTPQTRMNVQLMVLYRCKIQDPQKLLQTTNNFQCFTDAPDDIQFCREYVISFWRGSEDVHFPDDVGIPIGGADEANVYVLATHYDNPDYLTGLVDSSGIQLTYTSQLRTNEGAFLSMGNIISPNWLQFIPPGEESFTQKAYCSQRCLAWGMRGSRNFRPITAVGVHFHSHSLGRAMKLRHFTYVANDTVTENPWLANDKTIDFEAQTFQVLKNRQQVGYWDQLLLECTYNSASRDRPTVGGWTPYDELCRAYVLYYPRKSIEGCMSWSDYDQLHDAQGQRVLNGTDVFPTLIQTDWPNSAVMRKNLKDALDNSVENGQCWSSRQTQTHAVDRFKQPRIMQPFQESTSSSCLPGTSG